MTAYFINPCVARLWVILGAVKKFQDNCYKKFIYMII